MSIHQSPLAARVVIDPLARVAPVKRRLFGSFVEHLGRCVYTGIYEPGHPTADEDGFRGDVLALTQELGVSVVRYPGGNFVSNYRWEDGVGPRDRRPVRRDLAWRTVETNEFGTDEFIKWASRAGVEPMLALNLGTRGVAEAIDMLEYANHPSGTTLSDERVANGAADPHAVRLWCLGNELDGPWQIGHKTAAEYGRLAAETARAMRQAEPDLELVACGSSYMAMPTFGSWEATVLEETYDVVDYISLHAYYEEHDGDPGSFLASAVNMDRFIDAVTATADHVRAKLGASKRIDLSFDEWNVWYISRFQNDGPEPGWPRGPRLLEDRYSVTDAVVVGNLLISLLRHADRVAVACQAQLANVIAPIMTDPGGSAWRQSTFHPFAATSRYATGDVLRLAIDAPSYETERFGDVPLVDAVATSDDAEAVLFVVNRSLDATVQLAVDTRPLGGDVLRVAIDAPCYETERFGEVPLVDAVATSDDAGAVLFVVNRSLDATVQLAVDTRPLGDEVSVVECIQLADADRHASNTAADPDRVRPHAVSLAAPVDGEIGVPLPPVSWTMVRLTHARS